MCTHWCNGQSEPGSPLEPLQAPLAFISPSIRAYQRQTPLATRLLPFKFGLSGYVQNGTFIDSNQIIGERQSAILYFPAPVIHDCGMSNINGHGSTNLLSFESRIRGEIAGPFIFGARTFGVGEIDFYAQAAPLYYGIARIRHAFLYFLWKEKALLLGQYWAPIMVFECFPDVLSINGGRPIDVYARDPQMRFTKQFGDTALTMVIGSRATTPSDGPAGVDTIYTRNAILPHFNVQIQNSIKTHYVGFGVDVTRIVPRIATNKNFRITESLMNFFVFSYVALLYDNLNFRMKFIYGQNASSYELIGGYAVHSIDPYTDRREYTNIQSLALWVDTAYNGEVQPGLFMGVIKNIGASKSIIPYTTNADGTIENLVYANGRENIDYVFRASPRIRWFIKPLILGAEFEYTRAAFGTITTTGNIARTVPANNFRALLAAYYVF